MSLKLATKGIGAAAALLTLSGCYAEPVAYAPTPATAYYAPGYAYAPGYYAAPAYPAYGYYGGPAVSVDIGRGGYGGYRGRRW